MAEATDNNDPPPDDLRSTRKRHYAVMEGHVAQLMEFFDSVQIICTKHNTDDDQTMPYTKGDGNWYARYASVKEWIVESEEQMRIDQRKRNADD